MDALTLAVENAGGQSALARKVGLRQQAIWHWINVSKRVPAERVLAVEAASGVPRHELRPDIYPPEDSRGKSRGE
jgi:DNA-binding transcriptional regulator YdaS (Cro superfamily)